MSGSDGTTRLRGMDEVSRQAVWGLGEVGLEAGGRGRAFCQRWPVPHFCVSPS